MSMLVLVFLLLIEFLLLLAPAAASAIDAAGAHALQASLILRGYHILLAFLLLLGFLLSLYCSRPGVAGISYFDGLPAVVSVSCCCCLPYCLPATDFPFSFIFQIIFMSFKRGFVNIPRK
jgi:hypothetical protein